MRRGEPVPVARLSRRPDLPSSSSHVAHESAARRPVGPCRAAQTHGVRQRRRRKEAVRDSERQCGTTGETVLNAIGERLVRWNDLVVSRQTETDTMSRVTYR